jgi:LCP family protein required for cell wall assembly
MRTTLKRGIGRGAAVNGNGRAVLPPGTITPVTRYRQPEPPPRRPLLLVGKILLWLLAGLLMLAAGLLGGAYLYFHEKVSDIQAHTPAVKIAQKRLAVPLPDKPTVALVVGYDHRLGIEKDLESRSDTIMLLRADPQTKSISMLSFPRDLRVEIRCPGKLTYVDRINGAYSECGLTGTVETVKQLTGLDINYLITVNFRGFKQIVDRLGGVWMDVDRRYFNDNRGLITGVNTYATIDLQPGYQRLTGSDALDFVRYRHTDSDLFRVARQQLFVKAIKEQINKSFSLTSLPTIIDAITSNVEIGQGGGKTFSAERVSSYALFAYRLPAGHFFQARIPNLVEAGPSGAELAAGPADIQAAVNDFVSPDVEAPDKAAAAALGRKLRSKAPTPQDTTVTVLNGNGVTGSATNAAYELTKRGYEILVSPTLADRNAPSYGYFRTKVYFDPRRSGARAAADRVDSLFGDADVEPLPAQIRTLSNAAMIVVVVGETFHGTLAPTPVDRTPKRQLPYVQENPGATLALVRPIAGRIPFRLEVPRLLERTSLPAREQPVRVYPIAKGHRAVRLTYRTGGDANEYWGIEQTDWEDAPVLAGPNFDHVLGGRRFDFYYSGPHLHMVVLREKGASYWVVNTLLDSLSNETMIAIAKGLRPLAK